MRARGALIAFLITAGCGGAAERGNGFVVTRISALTGATQDTRVNVSVAPANVSQDLSYDSATATFAGTLTVQTGTQTITATAFAGTTVVGIGTATVVVTAGQ